MNKTLQTVYIHENSNKTDAYYSMRQAILLTQEEYNTLIQENTYLKAELEANKDKAKNEWICFEDSMPEKDTAILICDGSDFIEVHYYDSDSEAYIERFAYTHWKPLPPKTQQP